MDYKKTLLDSLQAEPKRTTFNIAEMTSRPVTPEILKAASPSADDTASLLMSKYHTQRRPTLIEEQANIYKSASNFTTFDAWLEKYATTLDALDADVKSEVIQKAKAVYTRALLERASRPDPSIQTRPRGA
jgi:hypothetical protein